MNSTSSEARPDWLPNKRQIKRNIDFVIRKKCHTEEEVATREEEELDHKRLILGIPLNTQNQADTDFHGNESREEEEVQEVQEYRTNGSEVGVAEKLRKYEEIFKKKMYVLEKKSDELEKLKQVPLPPSNPSNPQLNFIHQFSYSIRRLSF